MPRTIALGALQTLGMLLLLTGCSRGDANRTVVAPIAASAESTASASPSSSPPKSENRSSASPNSSAPPVALANGAIRLISFSRETPPPVQLPTPEVVVQSGHTHAVQDVAFSPDAALLATCSNDASVKLWDIRLGREVRTLLGAAQSLHTVAFRPDGDEVAASGPDGIVYRWNVADGKPLDSLTGHSAGIRTIVYSHSGETLASASDDKTVVLWDLKTATAGHILEHDQEVYTVEFAPDDQSIATLSHEEGNRRLTLWETATAKKIRSIAFDSKRGNRLRFSPDGKVLAVGLDRTTDLYSVETLERMGTVAGNLIGFRASDQTLVTLPRVGVVRFTKTGLPEKSVEKLVEQSAEKYSEIETPDVPDEASVQKLRDSWSPLMADFPRWDAPADETVCSDDGQLLASTTTLATVGIWDANTGAWIQKLGGRIGVSYGRGGGSLMRPFTIAWSPVAPTFAIGDRDLLRIVDLHSGAEPRVVNAHHGLISAIVFRPDGKMIATAGEWDRTIRLWDPTTGAALGEIDVKPAQENADSLAFSPDGSLLASGHWPAGDQVSRVVLWDMATLKARFVMEDGGPGRTAEGVFAAGGRITGVGFIEGGKTLISTHDYHNRISFWDVKTGKQLGTMVPSRTSIHGLATSPDHLNFAIATGLNKEAAHREGAADEPWLQFYRPEGEAWKVHTFDGHAELILAAAFSPDGKLLASGSGDCTAKLWSTAEPELLATFEGHTSDVGSLAFSHDGRFLATAGFDQTVRLWDVAKRELAATYVAFGRDDFVMVTPDNYYAASRQGLKGVTFRLGNRAVPFEQFDARLNRPDVVLGRLGYTPVELVDSYHRAYEKRLAKMQLQEDALQPDFNVPTLEVLSKPPLSTESRKLTLKLRAAEGQNRLDRLLAFDNDVPLWEAAGIDLHSIDASQAEFDVDIELAAGENKVQFSTLNRQGAESLKQTFDVVYHAPPRKPDLYVLAIGVSKYSDPRLQLRYAAKDAADVETYFSDHHNRFGNVKQKIITDADATRENILAAREFLAKSAIDDQVVVFFAGHGLLDAKKDYYFGTTDIDVKHLSARGVSYQEIEGLLDQIPARRRLLMMDTCHSGEVEQEPFATPPLVTQVAKSDSQKAKAPTIAVAKSDLPAEAKLWAPRGIDLGEADTNRLSTAAARTLENELFADLRRGCGGMVISSAAGSEFAIESPSWKNGVFTYALLEGLNDRKADQNGDGEIRVSELREYVMRRVQELTGGRQTPTSRRENLEIDFPVD